MVSEVISLLLVKLLQCFLLFFKNNDNHNYSGNNNYLRREFHLVCEVVGMFELMARTLCRRRRLLT